MNKSKKISDMSVTEISFNISFHVSLKLTQWES